MGKIKRSILAIGYLICALSLYSIPVSADTDGTELQVIEPSTLEIQLGTDWSGVEFQLRTDVGMYPDVIPVGEDGVLKLEIGGSSSYILTCLDSGVDLLAPGDGAAAENEKNMETESGDTNVEALDQSKEAAKEENFQAESGEEMAQETGEDEKEPAGQGNTVAGIPVTHLALFGGGLIVSIGALIAIRLISRRRQEQYEYDYDEEDDE